MIKKFPNTKVTVKIRKSRTANTWNLYLEMYPVFTPGSDKPQRKYETLNRIISTPIWDKSHPIGGKGKDAIYKPRRDNAGIIQCRSTSDIDACVYAENVRAARQHEYDNAALYAESDERQALQNERDKVDFVTYFDQLRKDRHKNDSDSIRINWKRVYELLKIKADGKPIPMKSITVRFVEQMKPFFLSAPQGGGKSGTLSQSSASTYFAIFKAGVRQAFIDEYLTTDIASKVKGIPADNKIREYLSLEEVQKLVKTPCSKPVLKRAAIFSVFTGLRHCDIRKMKWSEIVNVYGQWKLHFKQRKTKNVEYMPISDQAYKICGEPGDPNHLVFYGLQDTPYNTKAFKQWITDAGINRDITFHCMRHTFATLQLANGTDIYTISKMLGHTKVETTQIYTKVVDQKKIQAANTINLEGLSEL